MVIVEVGEDPLDPYAVIFLLEGKLLQALHIKVTHVLPILQINFGLLHQLRTLVHQVHLCLIPFTVLNTWHRSCFDILPIPAPQSSTEFLENEGLSLHRPRRKVNENLISLALRCP